MFQNFLIVLLIFLYFYGVIGNWNDTYNFYGYINSGTAGHKVHKEDHQVDEVGERAVLGLEIGVVDPG